VTLSINNPARNFLRTNPVLRSERSPLISWGISSHVTLLRSHFFNFFLIHSLTNIGVKTTWPSGYLLSALVSRSIFGIRHTSTQRTFGCVIWQVCPQEEESKLNYEISSNRPRCSAVNTREFRYVIRVMKDSERRYCANTKSLLKCVSARGVSTILCSDTAHCICTAKHPILNTRSFQLTVLK
jgi:hypothetical protein